MNDLSKCGEACNCGKCRVDSYFAQRKDPEYVPTPIKFHELDDGVQFMLAIPYAYGSRRVYVKATEDGDNHNAVSVHNSSIGIGVDHNTLVIPIKE